MSNNVYLRNLVVINLIVILIHIHILGLLAIKCCKLEFILIETLIGRNY